VTTEYRFGTFLRDSFATLQRELPDIYAEMCRRLAPQDIAITVDSETVRLKFAREAVLPVKRLAHPTVMVRTGRKAILDLIDARSTLLDAAVEERLHLRGSPDDLARFYDGLMAYLHGAVRSPSFPALLQRFRYPAARSGKARRRNERIHP